MKTMVVLFFLCGVAGFGATVLDADFVNLKNRVDDEALIFARSGVAINRDGTSAADGVARTDTTNIISPTEVTEVAGYTVIAASPQYNAIYAVKSQVLYKSTDGKAWVTVGNVGQAALMGHITEKGTLIVGVGKASGGTSGTIWRYDGTTLSQTMADGVMLANASATYWSVSEAGGVIFVGEYLSTLGASNGRRVWASRDDGLTWTLVHNPDHVAGRHLHRPQAAIVDGIVTCYVTYGDSTLKEIFKIQEDAAGVWTATDLDISTKEFTNQPTAGVWIPEKNIIVWGSDGGAGVGLYQMDLSDNTFTKVLALDRAFDGNFSWLSNPAINFYSMYYYRGTYYAICTETDTAVNIGDELTDAEKDTNIGGIYASRDGTHWAKVVSYSTLSNLAIRGVDIYGRMWCSKGSIDGSFYFQAPTVSNQKGIVIERASRNFMDATDAVARANSATTIDIDREGTEKLAGFDAGNSWLWRNDADADDTGGEDPDDIVTATTYLAVSRQSTLNTKVRAGDQLIFNCRFKGTIGDGNGNNMGRSGLMQVRSALHLRDSDNTDQEVKNGYLTISPTVPPWQHYIGVMTSSYTHDDAGKLYSLFGAYLYIEAAADPDDAQWNIYLDMPVYELANYPSEWSVFSALRGAETLVFDPESFPAVFTDVFNVGFRYSTEFANWGTQGDGESYLYLKSYAVDNDNFFAVVYDTYDKKVKIVNEAATVNSVVCTVAEAIHLWHDESINIAVTRSGTTVALYVYAAGDYQTASGTITNHTIDKCYWGSHPAGTQGGSFVYVYNQLTDSAMTAAQVQDAMRATPIVNDISGSSSGGLNTRFNSRFGN